LREKLKTSFDLLDDAEGAVIPVLNKADLLSESELAEREEIVGEVAERADVDCSADPVPVSATEDRNLDALRGRIGGALAERREVELALPNDDAAMSLVSWLYDRASVSDVSYCGDEVRIEFSATESLVERARGKADGLEGQT
jgi:GTP-binding protein HflX